MSDGRTIPAGRYIVPALAQGLAALRLFTHQRTRISAPEIASDLGLPRTTVFRIIHTLESMGFICREDDGRHFRLGQAMLGSGFAYLASLDYVEVAQPILQKLRAETGMSVHMAIRDGRDILYVSRYAAHTTVRSSVTIGTRFPVHATVMGRMLLSDMPLDELKNLFPEKELPRFSDQTPANVAALAKLLVDDRARGYVVSQSYFERGVSSVAAPVRDSTGAIVAAINVTSVDGHADVDLMKGSIKDATVAAAKEITSWMSSGDRTGG